MQFQPISSYGFIGNLGSCALVNVNGSIDWCCLPRIDCPSVFGALLDPGKGGSFVIRPVMAHGAPASGGAGVQSYLPLTNVLQTRFRTDSGVLEVTDWMHMGEFSFAEEEHHRFPFLYRRARCTEGTIDVDVLFDPRLNYARGATMLAVSDGGVRAQGTDDAILLRSDREFRISAEGARARFRLGAGEETTFICTYGKSEPIGLPEPARSLEETRLYWTRWSSESEDGGNRVLGEWHEYVIRSALVLKVLAGGKGIAAAATTSLPERLGGGDNWDYRFSWIRDTSFTIQALTALGHLHDGREFLEWICELLSTTGRRPADLQVLYSLCGAAVIPEEELSHLRGYGDSRPVRIGNGAVSQRQLDIYGELLDTVFRSEHLQPGVDQVLCNVLRDIVEYVCDVWHEPDHGIWELREGMRHYVYSKVMCWVAVDRGIRLAEAHGWAVDLSRWKAERDAIKAMVMERGYSEKRGAFTQAFDDDCLDATALLFPVLEFISPDHPYAASTLAVLDRELSAGALVYRSEQHRGKEGAFGLCGFWMVDALCMAGRVREARERFLALLAYRNHVGLYAEEIDPATGAFLGNFPQAFTHVGLINSALYLARAEGKPPSPLPLMGERHLSESSRP